MSTSPQPKPAAGRDRHLLTLPREAAGGHPAQNHLRLGGFAAQTLLKTVEKISQLRGRFYEYRGIKVMPTYHPAFLLRNPHKKREAWGDMKKIHVEYIK